MISNVLVWEKRTASVASLRLLSEKATQVKKTEDNLQASNPYFDKYKDKIAKMKKENPSLYMEKLDQFEKPANKNKEPVSATANESTLSNRKDDENVPDIMQNQANSSKHVSNSENVAQNAKSNSLDKIMRLELLQDLPSAEIANMWKSYHADKNFVSAVIDSADYKLFNDLIQKYPAFLLALPKNEGFEFVYTQNQFSTLLFTKLSSFQLHRENAPIILSLQFYTELMESKQIVLMRGEYDSDCLSPMEAQTLVNQHQIFYNKGASQDDKDRLKLVESFNLEPDKFDYNSLLKLIPGFGEN